MLLIISYRSFKCKAFHKKAYKHFYLFHIKCDCKETKKYIYIVEIYFEAVSLCKQWFTIIST